MILDSQEVNLLLAACNVTRVLLRAHVQFMRQKEKSYMRHNLQLSIAWPSKNMESLLLQSSAKQVPVLDD